MPRLRSMSAPLLLVAFAVFLFPVAARGSCYEPLCCTYPPVQGTTHIESVSPQVALPGVTRVYIEGYCFGDSQGSGSITLNGEVMTDIVFWTDAEIEFIPPDDATSGNLVVTSSNYGSDSTAQEANCVSSSNENLNIEPDYCGNGEINATFSIAPVAPPYYWNAPLNGTAWAPEYVQGTWYFDDGGETMTLTLNQGSQNADGTWTITGEEVDNLWGQYNNVSGTLDQYGDLALCLAWGNESPNGLEWLVLGSGDVTSQGLNRVACTPGTPPVATRNFLDGDMDLAEGPYYYLGVPPLFKSATDKPPGETVTPLTPWLTIDGSTLPTAAAWERTLLPLNSLGLVDYAGRFVYEQSGGAPTDGCYYNSVDNPQPEVTATTLTGGGWYVDPQGDWGPDGIGMKSAWDSDYQNYYGPKGESCVINTPQDLYIDTRTWPVWVPWITDTQMPAEITPKDLFVGLVPGQGELVTACEPYPNTNKGKCR
ncbi:MAG: hypothetical protein P8Z30_19360 [Acidobacteriota bacterium]